MHEALLIKAKSTRETLLTTTKKEKNKQKEMFKIKSILNTLPVLLGALYLIAEANEMDYEYAWDHSIYPPFTGTNRCFLFVN